MNEKQCCNFIDDYDFLAIVNYKKDAETSNDPAWIRAWDIVIMNLGFPFIN